MTDRGQCEGVSSSCKCCMKCVFRRLLEKFGCNSVIFVTIDVQYFGELNLPHAIRILTGSARIDSTFLRGYGQFSAASAPPALVLHGRPWHNPAVPGPVGFSAHLRRPRVTSHSSSSSRPEAAPSRASHEQACVHRREAIVSEPATAAHRGLRAWCSQRRCLPASRSGGGAISVTRSRTSGLFDSGATRISRGSSRARQA